MWHPLYYKVHQSWRHNLIGAFLSLLIGSSCPVFGYQLCIRPCRGLEGFEKGLPLASRVYLLKILKKYK